MRKCLRCETVMQENLALYSTDSHWRIMAAEPKALFPNQWENFAAPCARSADIRSCMLIHQRKGENEYEP